jgi:hypothetical protein
MKNLTGTRLYNVLLATTIAATAASSLDAQSLRSYGKGTAGSGGKTPFLWAASTPRPGNTNFGLTIDNGRPGSLAVCFLSLNKSQINLGGVDILIDFSLSFQLPFVSLNSTGKATYQLPMPATPSILGSQVFQQAFVSDPGGAALGFAATQGLDLRVANFGILLGTRSTGSATPHLAINLDTGVRSSVTQASMTNAQIPGMYPGTRSHCMVGSGRSGKVAMFDCQVFPPKFVTEFAASGTPWCITWHPDGSRAYVVNQASASSTAEIQVVWALPGLPTIGNPYPGGNIPLGPIKDAMRMVFPGAGDVGLLSTLGLFGGGGELRKYDTRPSSPTYHNLLASYKTSGQYHWDMCQVDEDTIAVAVGQLAAALHIELIDINTMQKKASFGPGGFGGVVRGLVADPRGRYLYVGNNPASRLNAVAGILRINIDANDPNYGQIDNINAGFSPNWGNYDVELSDAGDRLYALIGTGIQTSFVGKIVEYNTTTLAITRTWSMNGTGNMYNLAIR